jgi:hypothetical protein
VRDGKKLEGAEPPLATVGAIGLTSPKMFAQTLVPQQSPTTERGPLGPDSADETLAESAAGRVAAPAPERTIEVSASDADVILEKTAGRVAAPAPERTIEVSASDADVILARNPPPTQTGLTLDARKVAANEPTYPGVFRERLKRRKSIVLSVASGLGVVALALTVRGLVHQTSATASGPPVVSAATVPAASLSPSPPATPPAPDAIAVTADSVTPPPKEPPAASAPAKNPASRTRPARPKHAPSKVTR